VQILYQHFLEKQLTSAIAKLMLMSRRIVQMPHVAQETRITQEAQTLQAMLTVPGARAAQTLQAMLTVPETDLLRLVQEAQVMRGVRGIRGIQVAHGIQGIRETQVTRAAQETHILPEAELLCLQEETV
jgi:hypothetical protein